MKIFRVIYIVGIIIMVMNMIIPVAFGCMNADILKPLSYENLDSLYHIQEVVRSAAEEGNIIALNILRQTMYGLGQDMALEQTPSSEDLIVRCNKAIEDAWLQEVIRKTEQQDPFFTVVLAVLYYYGNGVKKDPQKALQFWQQAAKYEFGLGKLQMGKLYEGTSQLVSTDYQKAAEFYSEAGELGNPMGWYRLGILWYEGKGIPQNNEKPIDYWFRNEKAVEYWLKAAKKGHAKSQHNVGWAYASGKVMPPDNVEQDEIAKKWLLKAIEQGYQPSKDFFDWKFNEDRSLFAMLADIDTSKITKTKALEYLQHAKQIYSETFGKSDEFIKAIKSAEQLFPVVEVSLKYGEAKLMKYRMNTHGIGLDGIRFTAPEQGWEDFTWVFAAPENMHISWFLSPTDRYDRGGWDAHVLAYEEVQNPSWPKKYSLIVKPQINKTVKPGHDYTLCFFFPDNRYVDLYIGFAAYSDDSHPNTKVLHNRFRYELNLREIMEYAFGIERVIPPKEILRKALERHDKAFIDYALEQGARINDMPALWYAAKSADLSLIQYLLHLGADPNKRQPSHENSALHAVCERVSVRGKYKEDPDRLTAEIIDMLVEAGIDVNVQNKYGQTPLMFITKVESPISVKRLLHYGADPSIKDIDGKTALDVARKYDAKINIELLESALQEFSN